MVFGRYLVFGYSTWTLRNMHRPLAQVAGGAQPGTSLGKGRPEDGQLPLGSKYGKTT